MPSLHLAIAPTGLLSSLAPDPAVALEAVEAFDALAGLGVDAGAAGGAPAAAAVAPAFTPPWPEQAPRPPFDIEPSVQVTIAALVVALAGAAAAGAGAAAAVAAVAVLLAFGAFAALAALVAFATPPCPEHAPRPDVALVVPSLHVVAVACALAAPALSADAIAIAAAIANEREMSRIAISP